MPVSVKDPAYGAVGNGTTDDTTAVVKALTDVTTGQYNASALGENLYFPKGRYKITSAISTDLAAATSSSDRQKIRELGLTLYGDGNQTVLDFESVTSGDAWQIYASTGTTAEPYGQLFFNMEKLHIIGKTTGTLLRIGKRDYSDAFNAGVLQIYVANDNLGLDPVNNPAHRAGPACEMNFLLGYEIIGGFITGYWGGLILRQAHFNRFFVSAVGVKGAGLALVDGVTKSNVFHCPDLEGDGSTGTTGLAISSSNAINNTFVSPMMANVQWGVSATAGSANRLITPYWGAGTTHYNPNPPVGTSEL